MNYRLGFLLCGAATAFGCSDPGPKRFACGETGGLGTNYSSTATSAINVDRQDATGNAKVNLEVEQVLQFTGGEGAIDSVDFVGAYLEVVETSERVDLNVKAPEIFDTELFANGFSSRKVTLVDSGTPNRALAPYCGKKLTVVIETRRSGCAQPTFRYPSTNFYLSCT
jgi:hypothetical protein